MKGSSSASLHFLAISCNFLAIEVAIRKVTVLTHRPSQFLATEVAFSVEIIKAAELPTKDEAGGAERAGIQDCI